MIDTDKYEGHTPAPWEISTLYLHHLTGINHAFNQSWLDKHCQLHEALQEGVWVPQASRNMSWVTVRVDDDNPADYKLIADAPLFLAEIKQLRKQLGRYTQFVLWVEEEHNEVFDEYEGKDEL